MEKKQYVELIRKRLSANFEIEAPAIDDGEEFLMIARYHQVSGRLFVTKKDIIDKYETFETCYMKELSQPGLSDIESFFSWLTKKAETVRPGKDHFYTDITGILVSDHMPEGAAGLLKGLNFQKSFLLFFRGYLKIRLVCVDLGDGNVYTNKLGKEIKRVYQW